MTDQPSQPPTAEPPAGDEQVPSATLGEIAALFLRLGFTAFGGPAAHIAMMEHEVVRRRSWLRREEFLDLIAATNLIPGPNSTEMAIHIGLRMGGVRGLLVAGSCFIIPATLMVLAIAWVYAQYGTLPEAERLLRGIKPVMIAVVVQALWKLGRTAVKSRLLAVAGLLSFAAVALGVDELLVLAVAGLGVMAVHMHRSGRDGKEAGSLVLAPALIGSGALGAAAAKPFGLVPLLLFFIKVGSILFGSGYVLLAFIRADLVERYGWLTEAQLLDAIAVGQITPGPVFTTATFIGYVLGGVSGGLVATVGIFLPAFVFVALSGPILPRLRRSASAGAFLDGVVVASLALMALVALQLANDAIRGPATLAIAVGSALLLVRYRINSAWLVLGGGLLGLAGAGAF